MIGTLIALLMEEMKQKKGFADGYKTYDTSNGYGNSSQWQNRFEARMNYKILSAPEKEVNKGIVQPLYDCINSTDLKKAYYKLMLIHHPDKAGDAIENKIAAQHINDIYFKLKEKFN